MYSHKITHHHFLIVFVLAVSFLFSACGGGGGSAPAGGGSGGSGVTATIVPSVLPLGSAQPIVIQFSKTMDTATVTVSGAISSDSYMPSWSTTSTTDDTLTLTPNSNWALGEGRDITIDGMTADATPETLATLSQTYNIYPGIIYFVDSAAVNDSGDGLTLATAKQNIQAAIDQSVTDLNSPATVVVNDGLWSVNSNSGTDTHIQLQNLVSLYGGFDTNFISRDPALYVSMIADSGNDSTSYTQPNKAVYAGSSVTASTVVDGFTINGSDDVTADYAAAIHLYFASPTLSNNIITGRTANQRSLGIYATGASTPALNGNMITAGTASESYGVYYTNANLTLTGNTISGGSGQISTGILCVYGTMNLSGGSVSGGTGVNGSTGIQSGNCATDINGTSVIADGSGGNSRTGIFYLDSSTGSLSASTISTGPANSTTGIRIEQGSSININNNPSISAGNGTNDSTAIFVTNAGSSATITSNTNIFSGTGLNSTAINLYSIGTGSVTISGNSQISAGNSGNYSAGISASNTGDILISNNSISGGFSSNTTAGIDFTNTVNVTITGNSVTGGSAATLAYGIKFVSGGNVQINNNTMIDGGDAGTRTVGIFSGNSSGLSIASNTIYGGDSALTSYGIYDANQLSSSQIYNNRINAGENLANNRYGIFARNTASVIRNNDIYAGGLDSVAAILMSSDGIITTAPTIENNLLAVQGTSRDRCLMESSVSNTPVSIRNNAFLNCTTIYTEMDDPVCTDCNLMQMEAMNVSYSGNFSADPGFVDVDGADNNLNTMADNDWHLSAVSPAQMISGGINGNDDGGWGFTDDYDGVSRSAAASGGWAVGAYEYVP